jgi:hypothetical protein
MAFALALPYALAKVLISPRQLPACNYATQCAFVSSQTKQRRKREVSASDTRHFFSTRQTSNEIYFFETAPNNTDALNPNT